MKKSAGWILLGIVAWSLASPGMGAQSVTVTDMTGRAVTAPLDPARIVCIGPGALRLIVYLQAENKVAGVEDMEKQNANGRPYWLAHPELAALPRCGPGGPAGINQKPDMEALLAVRPQVVFITYMEAPLAEQVQRTLGIPVVVLSYGQFATFDTKVYEALAAAGRILNRDRRADQVLAYIESLRKDLQARTAAFAPGQRPSAYVGGIGYRATYGIESTERSYIPFRWTHADNVAERLPTGPNSHLFLDKETLLKLDPEVIFIDGGGLSLVREDYHKKPDFYRLLRAFDQGRVYTLLPFNWYTTNIDTALADAYAIGKILYPGRFADVDPEKKADEIYTFLVGRPVYAPMEAVYGSIGQPAPFLK